MDTARDGCRQAPAAAHHLWITGRAVTHRLAGDFFRSLLVITDSLFSLLWQPVRTDALLKGFVVKVPGCLGLVRGGVYSQYFLFFFLVLHSNTLQQRNWKSCLKVGHSSAVSIETSSQRAVRFTSTGGAFARRRGLQPVVPVHPGPPQHPARGDTGDTAQPRPATTEDNLCWPQIARWRKAGAQPHPPGLGMMPPAVVSHPTPTDTTCSSNLGFSHSKRGCSSTLG